jgi:uncharacterized protein YggE
MESASLSFFRPSRLKLVAFGLVLIAALALPAAAATPETRTITVVGSGEAELEGLPGEWTLVVSVEHERARTALRNAAAAVGRTQSTLRAAGTDFHTGEMALDAAIARDERVSLRGFEASTKIELALDDVQRAATVLDRVRAAGVTHVFGPAASDETSKELTRRALADGFDDAVEKAKRLTAKAGATLGPVLTIDERRTDAPLGPVFYAPGRYPRPEAPSRDVYVTVTVTFAIS